MVRIKLSFSQMLPSELCQRAIHQECNGGEKYWNLIDQRLTLVRKLAASNSVRATRCVRLLVLPQQYIYIHIPRAFKDILKTDRETYGICEDYEIGDVVADDWQQTVDDVVGGK